MRNLFEYMCYSGCSICLSSSEYKKNAMKLNVTTFDDDSIVKSLTHRLFKSYIVLSH